MNITVTITVSSCPDHPKYLGARRRTREDCWVCGDLYALRHAKAELLLDCKIEKVEVSG